MAINYHPVPRATDTQPWPLVLPNETAEVIERVRRGSPELFGLDPNTLRELLKDKKQSPNETIRMLRLRFWEEYDRSAGSTMNMVNVYREICQSAVWARAISNPYSLAWILTPPVSMMAQCDERIEMLMERIRENIEFPAFDPVKKKFDPRIAEYQLRALMYFDQRKHGAIVQRVENKTMSVHANVTVPTNSEKITKMVEEFSEEELRRKLEEAKAKNQAPKVTEVKAE